jgi:PAS domain S-box-containing protein
LAEAPPGEPLIGLLPAEAQPPQGLRLDALVRAPSAATDLPPLLRTLARAARDRLELAQEAADLNALALMTAALAEGGEPERLLAHVAGRVASRLTVERASLVLLDDAEHGTVFAASDDPDALGKRIELSNYPEIGEALRTGRPAVIGDAPRHPLLGPVRERIEGKGISALAAIPMVCEGAVVGILLIRSLSRAGLTPREVAFLSTIANAAAVALRNAGRVQSERRQRVAAEREVSQLRRYEEFFSHVNDGIAVLDAEGRVLTLNPAGCAVLGLTQESARGLTLPELVAAESAMAANLLARELLRGGRVLSVDLRVCTHSGRRATLSVSAGPLRSQNGRAILSFRDVSEGRELEAELRKTKEFLERLIDATSDGIVAADLKGRILLFNRGAERIIGLGAAQLVGRWSVHDLYPEGQARSIMQKLRAARAAGGELPPLRCELVAGSGEVVPVDLSAALVVEGGQETATVGVFRDLREEMRVEGELRQTRERLEAANRAAMMSELAGAAAHELNQPLTSVLGYSELLLRRGATDGRAELTAILHEAERMAGIVRKIGKIARYETTEYVGRTRIVDLDRASDPPKVIRDKG